MAFRRKGSNPPPPPKVEGSKGMEAAEAEIAHLREIIEEGHCRYNCRRREDIWKDGFNYAQETAGLLADEAYERWKKDNG